MEMEKEKLPITPPSGTPLAGSLCACQPGSQRDPCCVCGLGRSALPSVDCKLVLCRQLCPRIPESPRSWTTPGPHSPALSCHAP